MLIDKTIRLFLDGIGKREEYEFYLQKFQAGDRPAFAIVAPDIDSLRQGADVLVFDLQFLLQVDLLPVVVLSGPDAEEMSSLIRPFDDVCVVLGSFGLEDHEAVHAWIEAQALAGRVPVLVTEEGLSRVLKSLLPRIARRAHLVRSAGWLRNGKGEPIYHYYTRRKNAEPAHPDESEVLEFCRGMLEEGGDIHLSVTSPLHLLEELFTVKGAGTVIRRGSSFFHAGALADIEAKRLVELLENSFDKELSETGFLDAAQDFHIESDYRAAALLEPHPVGAFLSKFAVGVEARGDGLAQELWDEIVSRHEKIFWRSRIDNPINQWYRKKADGRHSLQDWLIFWRGLPPNDNPAAIEACRLRSSDFKDADP